MHQPLQITFRGIRHSDAIEARIREKAAELARFDEQIMSCHVTVEAPHHHHHKGNLCAVRMDLRLPGKEIVVDREHHEDPYVAIRNTFEAAVRQLEDYARRRRGDVKQHEVPAHGVVTKLFRDEGFGFLQTPDGIDVYFHENSVAGSAFSALELGDEVRVALADAESVKGPQASAVTPVGKHHIVTRPTHQA
jgi:ribosome-associated translation inhibitor RaiA